MKLRDILNLKNIKAFFEGYTRMLGDRINRVPEHTREQVIYRAEICKDTCVKKGKCDYCGCSVPGKLYVKKSCNNGERFPDLMNKEDWELFKKENNVKSKFR